MTEINLSNTDDPDNHEQNDFYDDLKEITGQIMVPFIFIGGEKVGGWHDLERLND